MRRMTAVLLTLSGCVFALSLIVAVRAEPTEVISWDKKAAATHMDGRLEQRNGLPKTSESRGTESILNAMILASRDARDGALSDNARKAFAWRPSSSLALAASE